MIQSLFGSTEEKEKKTGLFERMKQAVTRTRENLSERIDEVVSFSKEIDRNTLDDLEATLIGADLGAATTPPVDREEGTSEVVLVVGVNGTGKTTTIGKLAQTLRSEGKTVLLCAGDTFRAAAIEQLEVWGQRTG